MHAVRRVPDQRQRCAITAGSLRSDNGKGKRRGDGRQCAERAGAGRCDALGQRTGVEREDLASERLGRRPDHRHPAAGKRKPGQHAAVLEEPLERTSAMRPLRLRNSPRPRSAHRERDRRASLLARASTSARRPRPRSTSPIRDRRSHRRAQRRHRRGLRPPPRSRRCSPACVAPGHRCLPCRERCR